MAKLKKALKKRKSDVPLGKDRPIRVDLPHGPSAVVQAKDTGDAWQKFVKLCGIRGTEHTPKFSRPGPDCETDENGIVISDERMKGKRNKRPDDGDEPWDIEDLEPVEDEDEDDEDSD